MIFLLAVSPVVQAYVYNIIVYVCQIRANYKYTSSVSSTTASVSTGVSEGEVKQLKELSIVMLTVMITHTTEIVYMVTVCYLIQAH